MVLQNFSLPGVHRGKNLYSNTSLSDTQHFESIPCSLTQDDPGKSAPWLMHQEQDALLPALTTPIETPLDY